MLIFYSDNQLIADIKSRDDKLINRALMFLYEHYFSMANDIIKKRGGNSFWVKEIFQEAIIVLYESIKADKFLQKCSIKTYLYSIIRNKWLTATEKIQIETLTDNPAHFDSVIFANEPDDGTSKSSLVMNILENIGDPCKQLLINYYYEQMSMKEIAGKMKYSNEKSAKTQKFKCLQRFIDYIEKRSDVKHSLNELL